MSAAESWGCEFLDIENHIPPVQKFKTLPIAVVDKLVDQSRKAEIIAREKEYLHVLCQDIKQNGLREPLEITIAPNGSSLTEGNHRFICLELLEKEEIPVIIIMQEQNIKQGGISTYEFIKFILDRQYNLKDSR